LDELVVVKVHWFTFSLLKLCNYLIYCSFVVVWELDGAHLLHYFSHLCYVNGGLKSQQPQYPLDDNAFHFLEVEFWRE